MRERRQMGNKALRRVITTASLMAVELRRLNGEIPRADQDPKPTGDLPDVWDAVLKAFQEEQDVMIRPLRSGAAKNPPESRQERTRN